MRGQARSADPALLGLAAFVVSQLLLNIPNAHLVPAAAATLSLSTLVATGGLVQLLCAVFEFTRGNTFGTTTFGFYGSFFLALGGFLLLQHLSVLEFGAAEDAAFGTFLLVWGLFTLGVTVIAFRESPVLGAMFVLISGSFVGGALHPLTGLDSGFGGWSGIASAGVGAYIVFRGLWSATAPPRAEPDPVVEGVPVQASAR